MSDADIVLEAVVEDVQVKNRLFKGTNYNVMEYKNDIMITCINGILHCVLEFADIASLCPEEAVLFSNTLTLKLQDIFANIHKPEVNAHSHVGHVMNIIYLIVVPHYIT